MKNDLGDSGNKERPFIKLTLHVGYCIWTYNVLTHYVTNLYPVNRQLKFRLMNATNENNDCFLIVQRIKKRMN